MNENLLANVEDIYMYIHCVDLHVLKSQKNILFPIII